MLKVEITKNSNSIEACGNVVELCTDVSCLIKMVYDGLDNEDCKKFFAEGIKNFMNDEAYAKTSEELEEMVKKNKAKQEEEKNEKKKEIIKSLKELMTLIDGLGKTAK